MDIKCFNGAVDGYGGNILSTRHVTPWKSMGSGHR